MNGRITRIYIWSNCWLRCYQKPENALCMVTLSTSLVRAMDKHIMHQLPHHLLLGYLVYNAKWWQSFYCNIASTSDAKITFGSYASFRSDCMKYTNMWWIDTSQSCRLSLSETLELPYQAHGNKWRRLKFNRMWCSFIRDVRNSSFYPKHASTLCFPHCMCYVRLSNI